MSTELLAVSATVFIGGGVLALSTWVVASYWREWRRRSDAGQQVRGLLPLHVWAIALSYDLLVLLIVLSGVLGQGNLADWRALVRIPALLLGFVALFIMVNFQRRSYDRHPKVTKDDNDAATIKGSRG